MPSIEVPLAKLLGLERGDTLFECLEHLVYLESRHVVTAFDQPSHQVHLQSQIWIEVLRLPRHDVGPQLLYLCAYTLFNEPLKLLLEYVEVSLDPGNILYVMIHTSSRLIMESRRLDLQATDMLRILLKRLHPSQQRF